MVADVVDLDHVGMADAPGQPPLVDEHLLELGIAGERGQDHLHGHPAPAAWPSAK